MEKTTVYRSIVYRDSKPIGINHDIMAEIILDNYDIAHIVENQNTFVYKDGVYTKHGSEYLKSEIYRAFNGFQKSDGKALLTSHDVKEILSRVHALSSVSITEFGITRPILNVENGIIDLNTLELMKHSPDFKLLTKSPVIYDPDAECPEFFDFLDQAIESKYRNLLGEIIGYIFWPEYHLHKAFMFYGPKRTGKGTTTRTIEEVIGNDDCSHVSLQDLSGNRFARARLFGMKLNTYADLPADPIKDPGVFKNLTGEDTIDAENKFEQIFGFKNQAKLLYSANELPSLRRHDEAFYGRWIIVPFNNSVYGKENPNLMDKLTTPEELSGILNFGLDGLERLRSNGWRFAYEEDAAALYRRASNPVVAFLEDKCVPSEGYIVKAELVSAYNEYATEMRLPIASSKVAFGKAIIDQTVIPVETIRPSVRGRQVEAWGGIAFKN